MKRWLLLTTGAIFLSAAAMSGEVAQTPTVTKNATDPFAELLKSYPAEVVKTGPTCSIIRIELPPGVSADEIGDFSK